MNQQPGNPLTASDETVRGFFSRIKVIRNVVIGILMLAVGVWMAHGQTQTREKASAGLQLLREAVDRGIPVLSTGVVEKNFDGQIAYLQGTLKVGNVTDPLTGLRLAAGSLHRTVETQQWQEIATTRKAGSFDYGYQLVWSDRVIDSDKFHSPLLGKQQEHVNPKTMPYETNTWFEPEDMRLGVWHIPVSNYAYWLSEEVPVPNDVLSKAVNLDNWYVNDGYLQTKAYSPVTTRFHYDYRPIAEDVYSMIGIPRDGVLDLDDQFQSLQLITLGAVDAETLVSRAESATVHTLKYWMAWIFIGTLLVLRPIAGKFRALQGFSEASTGRRWVISLGVAALCTVLVGWLT